jgi:uncharacterized membrane protein YfcA
MILKKTTMQIIILILVGLIAGALSGLIGIGGGLVIVPALVYLVDFSQHKAQGTSLGLLLLPAGILAVIQYYRQGDIDFGVVALLAVGFVVGGYYGSKLALSLPQDTLKKVFAILLIVIAVKMLFFDKQIKQKAINNNTEKTPPAG